MERSGELPYQRQEISPQNNLSSAMMPGDYDAAGGGDIER